MFFNLKITKKIEIRLEATGKEWVAMGTYLFRVAGVL